MKTGKLQRQKRPSGSRHGVAAAEFAVCLPIVVLMVLGTIEACSMVFLKQSLTVSSYEGVRTALEEGMTATDIQNTCNQILRDRRVQGGVITISPSNIQSLNPGDFVDVTVSAPCNSNAIIPNTFYGGRTLSATASMMIEF